MLEHDASTLSAAQVALATGVAAARKGIARVAKMAKRENMMILRLGSR